MGQRRRGGTGRETVGTATYLFTDLVGSTQLIQRLGDDVSDPLIRRHLRSLRSCAEAHGGRVVKMLGDGLMAVFQSGAAAVDCAVSMQQTIHNETAQAEHALGLRVGLHTGEATWDGEDYYGMPVWIARRLSDAAEGGQILCSTVVRDVVGTRGGHRFLPAGTHTLKGVDDPVEGWEVTWAPVDEVVLPERPKKGRSTWVAAAAAIGILGAAAAAMALASNDDAPERPGSVLLESPSPTSSPERPLDFVAAPLEEVSVRSEGSRPEDPDEHSSHAAVSRGGRTVVFASAADLHRVDNNGFSDIYVHDLRTDVTTLITEGADGPSRAPVISASGSVIAFESDATNLVEADTNGATDVFVYRTERQTLERISVQTNGTEGRGRSWGPDISASGEVVGFTSDAPNLSALPDRNGVSDVFVRDLRIGVTNRVSLGPGAAELERPSAQAAVSTGGRFVAFVSAAAPFTGDGNTEPDVFVWDRVDRETTFASAARGIASKGASFDPVIAGPDEAAVLAFVSRSGALVSDNASDIPRVFVRAMGESAPRPVVPPAIADEDVPCYQPSLSSDARMLALVCESASDGDAAPAVYVMDLEDQGSGIASASDEGVPLEAPATFPALSPDGLWVAFQVPLGALTQEGADRQVVVVLKGPFR